MFDTDNIGLQTEVTTDPQGPPVTTPEVLNYLKAQYGTDAVEDALVDIMTNKAVDLLQDYTGLSFITQTRKIFLESYGEKVPIPYGPVQSVTSVSRLENGVATALVQGTDYYLLGLNEKYLKFSKVWKSGVLTDYSLEVEYIAGFTDHNELEDFPDGLKEPIFRQINDDYYYRSEYSEDGLTTLSKNAMNAIPPNYVKKATGIW